MPRPTVPCGTEGAYQRHMRRKEKPCEPCKGAHTEKLARDRGYRTAEDRYKEAGARKTAHENALATVEAELAEINELEDLIFSRKRLLASIEILAKDDPSKISPLSKELRAVHTRINELNGGSTAQKEESFDDLLTLSISRAKAP